MRALFYLKLAVPRAHYINHRVTVGSQKVVAVS